MAQPRTVSAPRPLHPIVALIETPDPVSAIAVQQASRYIASLEAQLPRASVDRALAATLETVR